MNSFKSINSKIAEKLINECKDLIIIDVRRFNEYKTGKIPNAINIPIEELEWEIEDLKEITKDPDVLNIIALREFIKEHNTIGYFNYQQTRKEESNGE